MNEQLLYLDTSAYIADVINEPTSKKIKKVISNYDLCTNVLLFLEAERTLVALSRQQKLSVDAFQRAQERLRLDSQHYILKDLNLDLCLTGTFPVVQTPRSNDLVHLRTALWFQQNGGLDAFLTLDEAQKRSAKDFSLPVVEV